MFPPIRSTRSEPAATEYRRASLRSVFARARPSSDLALPPQPLSLPPRLTRRKKASKMCYRTTLYHVRCGCYAKPSLDLCIRATSSPGARKPGRGSGADAYAKPSLDLCIRATSSPGLTSTGCWDVVDLGVESSQTMCARHKFAAAAVAGAFSRPASPSSVSSDGESTSESGSCSSSRTSSNSSISTTSTSLSSCPPPLDSCSFPVRPVHYNSLGQVIPPPLKDGMEQIRLYKRPAVKYGMYKAGAEGKFKTGGLKSCME